MAALTFPTNVDEFDQDERISFSKLDSKYIAVDEDDGTEYEFDTQTRKWIPLQDDDADDHADLLELNDPLVPDGQPRPQQPGLRAQPSSKKRKQGSGGNGNTNEEEGPKARPNKKTKAPPPPRQNTAVYVTGLPLDATSDEIHELFSRKGGMIAEEMDTGRPRIKMYQDEQGKFKGDALVVFYKPQSVEMAIMLLDETDFRFGESLDEKMRVQAADLSYKKSQPAAGGQDGEANKPQRSNRDLLKIKAKRQKMDAKLADWDDDDPYQSTQAATRWDKMVILRHMFTLEELDEDPTAILDIKEDIRDECSKLGEVTNVVLFDLEPDGIVSVKFKDVEAAEACIRLMHGRNFGGQTVEATISTGKERFAKSKEAADEEE